MHMEQEILMDKEKSKMNFNIDETKKNDEGIRCENEVINGKDLSLYIHIPFCAKKCDYCDFLSSPMEKPTMDRYMKDLIKEIKEKKEEYKDYIIRTIFIGGGTPSLIEGNVMKDMVQAIRDTFYITGGAEISIEINPGTVSKDKLIAYKEAGINRLSFGLQSTHNQELKLLGRIHTYEKFKENYLLARELGFRNINVDLMSGLPFQNLEDWMSTLAEVTSLEPDHISAYSLIVEPETPFYSRYKEEDLDENLDRVIYEETMRFLAEKGYRQYEISNYAKEHHECKHNIVYWTRREYLGLGLGSASMINNIRFSNERDIEVYMSDMEEGKDVTRDITKVTIEEQMEEYVFLGLRMTGGISIKRFEQLFGKIMYDIYFEQITECLEEELLEIVNDSLRLTKKGIDLSNTVMAKFLL